MIRLADILVVDNHGDRNFDYVGSATLSLVSGSGVLSGVLTSDASGGRVVFGEDGPPFGILYSGIDETVGISITAPGVTTATLTLVGWDKAGPALSDGNLDISNTNAVCLEGGNRIIPQAAITVPPADSPTGVAVLWWYPVGASSVLNVGTTAGLAGFDGDDFVIGISNGSVVLAGNVISHVSAGSYTSLAGVFPSNACHQLIVSWDCSVPKLQVVADGVLLSDFQTEFAPGSMPATVPWASLPAEQVVLTSGGVSGDVIFGATPVFYDLTNPTNVLHFRTAGGAPTGNLSVPGGVFSSLHGDASSYLIGAGFAAPFKVQDFGTSGVGVIEQAAVVTGPITLA